MKSTRLSSVATIALVVAMTAGCARPTQAPDAQTHVVGAEARALCMPLDKAALAGTAESWVERGRAWVRKARLESDPGYYLNVDACAQMALTLQAHDSAALELRGLALMNSHEFAAARALAEDVLRREPTRASAYGLLADAQLELGEFDAATAATQRQLDLRPDMSAHARASYLRWLVGDRAGARRLIRAALEDRDARDPEAAAWTFVEAANMFWQEGDLSGADAVYAEALRWLPDYPPALAGRGKIALARGDAARAVDYLSSSLQRRVLVDTATWLGDAYAAQGLEADAERSYGEAQAIGRRGDRLMLASFLAAQNRDPLAALRLLDTEANVRSNIYLDDARGWALYRLGRFDEALLASQRALRLNTPDARLWFHAGAIAIARGDQKAGVQQLQRALALNPAFDVSAAAEARTLLAAAGQHLLVARP